ncbi:hypothetical protein WA556_003274 [Blastocystis sp. ATCC 50177/Nand II]
MSLPAFSSIAGNPAVHHTTLTKEQKIEYEREKKREKTKDVHRRKGQRLAQERDAMLSTMTEEEKRAWKEEQQRLELEERKALEEGVLHGQRIAIDINYQEKMTTREQLSLVKQLCFAHNANKRATKHISMHICGFSPATCKALADAGADRWPATFHDRPLESVFAPSELVYLSPDGAQSLQQVDSAKVYVVGGFVDRSVNKNQSAMRASLLEVPSVRLPIKEYYPECSNPILNVNTVVEILIAVGETGDWRTSLVNAIPQRKVQHLSNQKEEYDFRRIVDEKTLLSLPITRLTKFEIKQALERYCIQHKKKLTFERNEHDKASVEKKEGDCPSVERFEVKAVVDGTVMGAGSGSNTRIAAAFASWRALKAMGVLDESEAECVSE